MWKEAEAEAEAAWRTAGPHLGKRLVRTFDGVESRGHVVGWIPEMENSGVALWHVKHEDGDEEDLEADEVEQAISNWVGVANGADAPSANSKRPAEALRPFQVGDRVQALFGGGLIFYNGIIDGRSERNGGSCVYSIKYDDGDREEGVDPHSMRHEAGAASTRWRRMDARARGGAGELAQDQDQDAAASAKRRRRGS